MNITYPEVPSMISGKDLDYLSDMFEWNCGAYKTTKNSSEQVKDDEIKQMIQKASMLFSQHVTTILDILGGGKFE